RAGIKERGVESALEQIVAFRGRELVDFLTTRVEDRVRKEVDLAEPRIRALEAPGARLSEHHLADHEIAEPAVLHQAPDFGFVIRAAAALVFGQNECPVPGAADPLHCVAAALAVSP